MLFSRLNILSAFAGLASAHFTLNYPPTRGFEEDQEVNQPCGGFNTVGTRTPFSLGDTFITLESEHETPNVLVLITFDQNPTDIKNFTTTANGTQQAPLRNFFQVNGGDICIGVNVGSIGYPEAKNGTNATISVQYSGGDGDLWQCADVVLLSSATPPSNVTCNNEYQTTAVGAASGSSTGSASQSASSPSSTGAADRLTVGIGAMIVNALGLGLYLM